MMTLAFIPKKMEHLYNAIVYYLLTNIYLARVLVLPCKCTNVVYSIVGAVIYLFYEIKSTLQWRNVFVMETSSTYSISLDCLKYL